MTDARFPERYLSDRRVLRLSADEFRGWAMSVLWSVSNRTDGFIAWDEILLIPFVTDEIAAELVNRGMWEEAEGGFTVVDFEATQTSAHDLEVLDNMRRAQREKKRRQRTAKTAGAPSFSDVPGDSTGGQYPGTSRGRVPEDRTGEDRTGRDQANWSDDGEQGPDELGSTSWPVAPIGRSCPVCGKAMGEYPDAMKVCESQDDEHDEYRVQHGWAA